MKKMMYFAAMVALFLGCSKEVGRPTVALNDDGCSFNSRKGELTISASVFGYGDELTDAGICWRTFAGNPTVDDNKQSVGSNQPDILVNLTDLPAGSYTVRAYATNRLGTEYSDAFTCKITRLSDPPEVDIVTPDKNDSHLYGEVTNYAQLFDKPSSAGFTVKRYWPKDGLFTNNSDNEVYAVTDWVDKSRYSDCNIEAVSTQTQHFKKFRAGYNWMDMYPTFLYVIDAYATNSGGTGHCVKAYYYNSTINNFKEIDLSRLNLP